MHTFERFLFVIVRANDDLRGVGCFLMALVITFPISLREGRDCSPMDSFLSISGMVSVCRFFCDIFGDFRWVSPVIVLHHRTFLLDVCCHNIQRSLQIVIGLVILYCVQGDNITVTEERCLVLIAEPDFPYSCKSSCGSPHLLPTEFHMSLHQPDRVQLLRSLTLQLCHKRL